MKILATGSYCEAVDNDPPLLKALVESATGSGVRRIGRFIQLALIGAGRCLKPGTAPAGTGVYLASGRGDLEVTLTVLRDIFERHEAPMPLNFVNTVSNSACYYLARTLRISGPSAFATSRYSPFETALRLAWLDFARGTPAALVGAVDVCVPPVSEHRQRICVAADATVGEASHWLLLAPPEDATPALGHIPLVRSFPDDAGLSAWLASQRPQAADTVLAVGQHLKPASLEVLRAASGITAVFDYRSRLPYFDSQSAAVVSRFLSQPGKSRLVHIDGDPSGRFAVMVVERASGPPGVDGVRSP